MEVEVEGDVGNIGIIGGTNNQSSIIHNNQNTYNNKGSKVTFL